MTENLRVIQYGLGPIGAAVARQIVEREGVELVGGVDIDPAKVGQDLGELIGLGRPLGMRVVDELASVETGADVVVHTTSSYFSLFMDEILEILEAGLDIVSTSEELSFPWLAHSEEATEVDGAARRAGKTALGTGVNPGFLMDSLPLFLTSICQQVQHIDVKRVINASLRRGPFQAKIGSGMTVKEFDDKMRAGRMGHVGLPESMGMLFDTVGKKLVRYEAGVEPLVADRPIATDDFQVKPGQVRGLEQVARGYDDDGEFVKLTFVAGLEESNDVDTIQISGRPDLNVELRGTNGDLATVAMAVNAIRRVHEAAPGLYTMRDLPVVTVW